MPRASDWKTEIAASVAIATDDNLALFEELEHEAALASRIGRAAKAAIVGGTRHPLADMASSYRPRSVNDRATQPSGAG